ncbi:hypothetical protein [Leptolyngbya sp. 7M]|nr:hypothetical protein [Leptolyngbya sp. 7M]QYO66282.1 hypothetical protein JVX88_05640 [Leptolyngbya sp. 7M]
MTRELAYIFRSCFRRNKRLIDRIGPRRQEDVGVVGWFCKRRRAETPPAA